MFYIHYTIRLVIDIILVKYIIPGGLVDPLSKKLILSSIMVVGVLDAYSVLKIVVELQLD